MELVKTILNSTDEKTVENLLPGTNRSKPFNPHINTKAAIWTEMLHNHTKYYFAAFTDAVVVNISIFTSAC